jgi:signal transduction histidine kinase
MKLIYKLTLGFLLVSLIAIGLAAVFVWITTNTDFKRYLVDQRQADFVAVVTDYYRVNGNWVGVDTALRERGLLPPPAQPGSPTPDPQPFALVDQERVVIIASGDYQPGVKVQKATLAKGIGIEVNGMVVGTVLTIGQAAIRSPIEDRYLVSINRSLLIAALGGALLALFLGFFIARNLTRPLRKLTIATRAMSQGDLDQRVPVRSADELGELSHAFNQMSADLVQANQSRRQMTADIAHDLRNPLTVIGGYLESLQDGKLPPTPERFAVMQAEVQHLQRLVDDLRTLSLADAGELTLRRQPLAPSELLTHVAEVYHHQAEQRQINLTVRVAPGMQEYSLDLERMAQVLGNLVINALRYTPEGGEIILAASPDEGNLCLSVQDTGCGIPPDVLPHIFERSFRGDPSRSGNESGLGLAITKSIVELHGGNIRAESTVGKGSRFVIEIPC